jgi:cytochrome c-type biogenesis protein CcmH
MMRRAVLIAALLALLVPTAALAAHPRASFNDVENEVMCDTCNVPLNVAESPRADQERREIHQLIDQGLTKAQIKDRLKAEYGPDILALPQQSGFSLAAYLVPVAVVAALLALMAVLLPRWRRRPPGGSGGGGSGEPVLSLADARRLEEDLARHDV